jgi:4-hydroxy-tetrahydrodipicolinate reductase
MIRVAINGAAGRMGRRLVDLVSREEGMELVAALEQPGHPELGRDAGELCGCGKLGVSLTSDWTAPADVLIDFSLPAATAARSREAAGKGVALVIGTTGLTADQKTAIAAAAKKVPVLHSPNMSVGVNLLFRLAAETAAALGEGYDIEIVEAHHRFKKDAPSGTALRLAEEIAAATGRSLAKDAVYGRHGASAERKRGEIGIHAVRAGEIVGDHTILFSGPGERVEIVHRAESRDTFAQGALRAAKFLVGKKPGMYAMADALRKSR